MNNPDLISRTIQFVKQQLADAEGGHDWFHIERVYRNSLLIAQTEDCDEVIVKLGALLHDIADSKFHDGDESIGPKTARAFLEGESVDEATIAHMSSTSSKTFPSKAVILKRNSTRKNSKLCKMPTGSTPLERLELRERSTMVDSKTDRYTIRRLHQIFG